MPPAGLKSVCRQDAGELAQRLLMALIWDLREIAGEFQAHALARADRAGALPLQAFKEITDRHAQNLRDLIEPASRDAVDAALVFVRLLIGHPDQVSELLLGQAQHDAALAYPCSDMAVDILGAAGGAAGRGGAIGRGGVPAGLGQGSRRASAGFMRLFHVAPLERVCV